MAEWVRSLDWRPGGSGLESVYPALSVSFGGDSKSRRSRLAGVYAKGSKIFHQSALEMCHLSWTPHCSLEKDNSLNHSYSSLTTPIQV